MIRRAEEWDIKTFSALEFILHPTRRKTRCRFFTFQNNKKVPLAVSTYQKYGESGHGKPR